MSANDDDEDNTLRGIALGFRKRGLKTAKLLAVTGLKVAARGVGLSDAVDHPKAIAAAHALVAELDGLKGLSMKIGQMVSYLDTSLPPAAREVLSKLQSQSRPMAYDVVAAVVSQDLGQAPERLFDSFEQTPFAAASIGQVHRAVLNGTPVAVKIKYPQIDKAIVADIKTLHRLTAVLSVLSPIDIGVLIEEVATRVGEECDYAREAQNQEAMAQIMAAFADVQVPAVFRQRSGRSVLTSAYSSCSRFDAFTQAADQSTRNRAGAAIFDACFGSIFQYAAYNADPHPGNYLFAADGQVTLLDFGCIKWFEAHFIERWKKLALTVLDEDRTRFRQAFIDVGLVRTAKSFDFDHQFEAMRFFYQPLTSKEPFFFGTDYIRAFTDKLLFKNDNKFKLDMTPDWLFLNRLQFGLFSVLHHLGSRVVWGKSFRTFVENPLRADRPVRPK